MGAVSIYLCTWVTVQCLQNQEEDLFLKAKCGILQTLMYQWNMFCAFSWCHSVVGRPSPGAQHPPAAHFLTLGGTGKRTGKTRMRSCLGLRLRQFNKWRKEGKNSIQRQTITTFHLQTTAWPALSNSQSQYTCWSSEWSYWDVRKGTSFLW